MRFFADFIDRCMFLSMQILRFCDFCGFMDCHAVVPTSCKYERGRTILAINRLAKIITLIMSLRICLAIRGDLFLTLSLRGLAKSSRGNL